MSTRSTRPSLKSRTVFSRHTTMLVAVFVVGMGLIGLAGWYFNRPAKTSNTTSPSTQSSPTNTPATAPPGQPGNAGDVAKTVAPTPTTTGTASGTDDSRIKDFSITQIGSGSIRVTNSLDSISDGTCTLNLVSPTNTSSSTTGKITFDGHYYFCSFGSINGLAPVGSWTAQLQIQPTAGATASAHTSFSLVATK